MLKIPFIDMYNPIANPVRELDKLLSSKAPLKELTERMAETIKHPECTRDMYGQMAEKITRAHNHRYQTELFAELLKSYDIDSEYYRQGQKDIWFDKILDGIEKGGFSIPLDTLLDQHFMTDERVMKTAVSLCRNDEDSEIASLLEHQRCRENLATSILELVHDKGMLGAVLHYADMEKVRLDGFISQLVEYSDSEGLAIVLSELGDKGEAALATALYDYSEKTLEILAKTYKELGYEAAPLASFLAHSYAATFMPGSPVTPFRLQDIKNKIYEASCLSKHFNECLFFETIAALNVPAATALDDWKQIAEEYDHAPCLAAAFIAATKPDIQATACYMIEADIQQHLPLSVTTLIKTRVREADAANAEDNVRTLGRLVFKGRGLG